MRAQGDMVAVGKGGGFRAASASAACACAAALGAEEEGGLEEEAGDFLVGDEDGQSMLLSNCSGGAAVAVEAGALLPLLPLCGAARLWEVLMLIIVIW
mmetsp:Transcript_33836/g.73331  ORF Transcript_33836/g.73331 Transcript_33836/m.73331 type:complete len:98 (-) Transcript_33836:413-706(-)|eukprot:CAMPEP_0178646486 /NCGR_PEP_ID=MMETSP0698-20121128/19402_1 /TAXON_ID=265572 /ORGANISM="Extubocellulus spinifer, Strain CCMP396" /LENGTH=97 /DNA_ID=CAMNT_0020287649 /DNA_START=73 /DNA_END=366 /DNA_ORIENTATION=-